jgi:hypothetical protein
MKKKAGANAFTTQTKSPFNQGRMKTMVGQASIQGAGTGNVPKKKPAFKSQK